VRQLKVAVPRRECPREEEQKVQTEVRDLLGLACYRPDAHWILCQSTWQTELHPSHDTGLALFAMVLARRVLWQG
jgi:hypothetical protein